MKLPQNFLSVFFLVLCTGMLFIMGCDRVVDTRTIPPDGPPGIVLENPNNSNFLRMLGTTVDITLKVVDNEALKLLRVTESVYNPDGDTLLYNSFREDSSLTGEVVFQPYQYEVKNSVQGIPIGPYYKIVLTFYAIDTKGESASNFITINVIPDPLGPPPYNLHSYTGNRMLHPNSLRGKERFNFTSLTNPPDRPGTFDSLNIDVMIINQLPGPLEGKMLNSPANAYRNRDSVFVVTNSDRFNYDECNFNTISQAWFSDPKPKPVIAMPAIGDLVIIRLTKGQGQHFAVMKVTGFDVDAGAQYVEFDHKVTY